MESESCTVTDQLIEKIMTSQPLLDKNAQYIAIQGIIDYFAASLQACNHPESHKIRQWLNQEGGNANAWLVGQNQYATARQAAIYNGFQAHLLDYDDVHADVRGHPSAVIISALLASIDIDSELISCRRFLSAYIVGIELMAMLGEAVGRQHYQQGWHNTSTLGGIAATAAICYLHRYPFIKDALAIAATHASGLRIVFGTIVKPLHAGMAAQAAIESCQWAKVGILANCDFLDRQNGFLAVYGQGNQTLNIEKWGNPWRIVKPGMWFKNYPFCSAASYVADATKAIIAHYHFAISDIVAIKLVFSPQSDDALIYHYVNFHQQGRFSAEYIVAALLLKRPLTFETFNEQPIDRHLQSLMTKITRSYDHHATKRYACVIIELQNGQLLSQRVDNPQGSPANPYAQTVLKDKFFNAVANKERAKAAYNLLLKFSSDIPLEALIKPFSELFTGNQ